MNTPSKPDGAAAHEMKSGLRGRVLWSIDHAEFDVDSGRGCMSGWLLDTREHQDGPRRIGLRMAGRDFEIGDDRRAHREGVEKTFWFLEGASNAGFSLELPPLDLEAGQSALRVEVVDMHTQTVVKEANSTLVSLTEEMPIPSKSERKRVQGDDNQTAFLKHGLTATAVLDRVFREYGSTELASASVLDWGCGCGRIARYLATECGTYTGIDLDQANIEWCAAHLQGDYRHIQPDVPTAFESAHFDYIFGISVFSHLQKGPQFQWLRELARLAKPGGIIAMSVLGKTAACRSGSAELFRAFMGSSGYLDLGADHILDGHLPRGYYRTAFHSEAYLRARWSEFLDVVDILPGAVGDGHQDLVILQRPAARGE